MTEQMVTNATAKGVFLGMLLYLLVAESLKLLEIYLSYRQRKADYLQTKLDIENLLEDLAKVTKQKKGKK